MTFHRIESDGAHMRIAYKALQSPLHEHNRKFFLIPPHKLVPKTIQQLITISDLTDNIHDSIYGKLKSGQCGRQLPHADLACPTAS